MYRCIYCNSEDLSVSDIIPYALTGAKLTRRFVCRAHNCFTNDSFEKAAISNWQFFRSSLGMTERDGSDIKFRANFKADGVTVQNMVFSDRASLFEDKKRLFHGEKGDHEVLFGNLDKIKQIKGVREDNITMMDMHDAVISVSIDLVKLFASDEMLRTIAKTAYEWYCYIHDFECFPGADYQNIVECILMKQPAEDYVEICTNSFADRALSSQCYYGSHGIFEYTDMDGYKYVLIFFWGIALYKVRICYTESPNSDVVNEYNLFIYDLDGGKRQTMFSVIGPAHFYSIPAADAVKELHKHYSQKLALLLKTMILSLARLKSLASKLKDALVLYEQEPHDFARFLDYESVERFYALSILSFLYEHREDYCHEKSFNENLRSLYGIDDKLSFTEKDKHNFLISLQALHSNNQLSAAVESWLAFFDEICETEKRQNSE